MPRRPATIAYYKTEVDAEATYRPVAQRGAGGGHLEHGPDKMQAVRLADAVRNVSFTTGIIDRIVPGRLVYVAEESGDKAIAFKMGQVILDTPAGLKLYEGEDLDVLGVDLASPVRWGSLRDTSRRSPGEHTDDLRLVIKTSV